MAKEKQRGTVADKGKKKITTTGKGQENSCPAVQVLRERNIGVVIRDEQDINLMRLRATEAMATEKQKGTVADKGKKKITTAGKGKENSCPVVPNNNVPSLRRSVLWNGMHILTLSLNMRLNSTDLANSNFSEFLNEIGTNAEEVVELPSTIQKCGTVSELLFTVGYHHLFAADKMSFDDAHDRTITNRYPNEYLNSLNPSGLPPFKLDLKVDCPIMLLRNIAPKAGLCNGTRLMIVNCANRIIEAQILTGDKFGDLVFIPRISLTPSSSEIPFEMTRRQFPIRLAYAMTINKSQGQSVNFVGIDLRTPVFSHGQLYVALSRCTSGDRTSVLLSNDASHSTTNIVYPEVLL
ncbi:hypothetical protein RHGRI_028003 [Rhododendron griersonianum]|uniref:DNA helicase Pif1-like 2B domain-containing protein n=1 Tax=Rhododendron griersonianum TaxID=479676 RepID=A0AAV6IYX8_9ERIC|nr:hypothetical protein RHGRI_028003 [Rhododendron griersonianum]